MALELLQLVGHSRSCNRGIKPPSCPLGGRNGGAMSKDADRPRTVTDREQQVLELAAAGHSAKGVARQLDISPRTVERHLANLRHKLRARNRSELLAAAHDFGFLANCAKLRPVKRMAGGPSESEGGM